MGYISQEVKFAKCVSHRQQISTQLADIADKPQQKEQSSSPRAFLTLPKPTVQIPVLLPR